MKQRLSQKAFDLIVRFETGGREYYEKFLKRASWPGGSSGVTIGFGYDLGYEKNLDRDWGQFLKPDQLNRLARTLGKTARIAQQALSGVRDIPVEWAWGEEVFNENTLPQEIRKTLVTFPGSADVLSANAFGALVSLVFNRGTDLTGERRKEMKEIGRIIQVACLTEKPVTGMFLDSVRDKIAAQFRLMKRLWKDTPSDQDLVDRREAEAQLIESV